MMVASFFIVQVDTMLVSLISEKCGCDVVSITLGLVWLRIRPFLETRHSSRVHYHFPINLLESVHQTEPIIIAGILSICL